MGVEMALKKLETLEQKQFEKWVILQDVEFVQGCRLYISNQ